MQSELIVVCSDLTYSHFCYQFIHSFFQPFTHPFIYLFLHLTIKFFFSLDDLPLIITSKHLYLITSRNIYQYSTISSCSDTHINLCFLFILSLSIHVYNFFVTLSIPFHLSIKHYFGAMWKYTHDQISFIYKYVNRFV